MTSLVHHGLKSNIFPTNMIFKRTNLKVSIRDFGRMKQENIGGVSPIMNWIFTQLYY